MLGKNKYTYIPLEDWGNFISDITLGDVARIAVDAKDRVYLFNCGFHPVVVLTKDGDVVSTWGHGLLKNPHGGSNGPAQNIT